MKNTINTGVETTKKLASELLKGNAEFVFLPSGCESLKDSNYEPYLDCDVPESAIRVTGRTKPEVAIGDGFRWLPLFGNKYAGLRFSSAACDRIIADVEPALQHQRENLAGQQNEECTSDFLEWLHRELPTRTVAVLHYFLSNPVVWIVGLPTDTLAKHLFSEPPLDSGNDGSIIWYELRHLQTTEACT